MLVEQTEGLPKGVVVEGKSIDQILFEQKLAAEVKRIQEGVRRIEHSTDTPQGWKLRFHDPRACT